MARHLAALLALALLLAVAPAAPVPKGQPRPLYFPTQVGARWVYSGPGEEERTDVVTDVAVADGVRTVTVVTVAADGKRVPRQTLSVSDTELVLVGEYGQPCRPPLRFLKLPARVGEAWPTGAAGSRVMVGTMTVRAPERVTVPAGTFEAAVVDWEYEVQRGGNETKVTRYWFAPGVGLVRVRGPSVAIDLKAFTPGKD